MGVSKGRFDRGNIRFRCWRGPVPNLKQEIRNKKRAPTFDVGALSDETRQIPASRGSIGVWLSEFSGPGCKISPHFPHQKYRALSRRNATFVNAILMPGIWNFLGALSLDARCFALLVTLVQTSCVSHSLAFSLPLMSKNLHQTTGVPFPSFHPESLGALPARIPIQSPGQTHRATDSHDRQPTPPSSRKFFRTARSMGWHSDIRRRRCNSSRFSVHFHPQKLR